MPYDHLQPAWDQPGGQALQKLVQELYYHDKLQEAYEQVITLGAFHGNSDWFRLIEAEHMTRIHGRTWKLRDWLTVEGIPDELGNVDDVVAVVIATCESLAARFEWDYREPTWITVLSEASDVPWTVGRHGYCTDKYPYDKICLPQYLVNDLEQMREAVAHEMMHSITLNLCEGRETRWLSEAYSTLAEGRENRAAWKDFRAGKLDWLPPGELSGMLAEDQRDRSSRYAILAAYDQAAAIGHHMHASWGDAGMARLLRAIGARSPAIQIQAAVLGRPFPDIALRREFGITEAALFQKAFESLDDLAGP